MFRLLSLRLCTLLVLVGLLAGIVVVFGGRWPKNPPAPPIRGDRESVASAEKPHLNPVLERPQAPSDDYAGSPACTECHGEIARRYQSHPMARSLATVLAASPLEGYQDRTSFEAPQGMYYEVERRGGRVLHHERLTDPQGQTVYDDAVEVHFALGSGTRGRSYLIGQSGVLTMSPIGWYASKGWDLSPGYKPGLHQRFGRRITDGCLQCHSGWPHFERGVPNRFPAPPFHESAIGCERCHGPGAEHIAFQRRQESTGADPIVNPKRLAPEQREAVCYQCHLQAEERITRYGRCDHDFRPGQRITDVWTVYTRGAQVREDGSTAAVTQVEQLRSSRCFQQSGGRMGCTSCHDPHEVPERGDRSMYFRAKCLMCHADVSCAEPLAARLQSTPDGSCVECHMPKLTADVVPHTSQTDHRILPKLLKGRTGAMSATEPATFDDGAEVPAAEKLRARGLFLIRQAEPRQLPQVARQSEDALMECRREILDDPEVFEALGVACMIQQRPLNAVEMWSEALKLAPHRETVHWRLGTLYHDSGRFEEARDHLREVIQQNPAMAQAHARLAHIYGRLGHSELGIESAERALKLDPTLMPVYGWLAEAYSQRGNDSARLRNRELFDRLRDSLERIRANRP